ncbi:MAG: sulfatase-like hydrolase/transferase [Pseudomonadota bacterium]
MGNLFVNIMCDDLAAYDADRWGGFVQMPNLDAMKANGLNFTSALSPSAICNPARIGIYTGQYMCKPGGAGGHFIVANPQAAWHDHGDPNKLPNNEMSKSLMGILRQAGWQTVIRGKIFHPAADTNTIAANLFGAGYAEFTPPDVNTSGVTPDSDPDLAGFIGTLEDVNNPEWWAVQDCLAEINAWDPSAGDLQVYIGIYPPHKDWLPAQVDWDAIGTLTSAVLDGPADYDLPWYTQQVQVIQDGSGYTEAQLIRQHEAYLASMHKLDRWLGLIRAAIEAKSAAIAASGGKKNVILTSDHGYLLGEVDHLIGKTIPAPGVALSPLVIEATDIAPGLPAYDRAVSLLDIFPTVLGYFGIDPTPYGVTLNAADENGLDGRDLSPTFDGTILTAKDQFCQFHGNIGVLDGGGNWMGMFAMSGGRDDASDRPFDSHIVNRANDPWGLGPTSTNQAQYDDLLAKVEAFGFHLAPSDQERLEAGLGRTQIGLASKTGVIENGTGVNIMYMTGDQSVDIQAVQYDDGSLDIVSIGGRVMYDQHFGGGVDKVFHAQGTSAEDGITISFDRDHPIEVLLPRGAINLYATDRGDIIHLQGNEGAEIRAGDGDDRVFGSNLGASGNFIDGGDGDDTITASDGADTLIGGAGDDRLQPGGTGDVTDGSADIVSLGSGSDIVDFNNRDQKLTVLDWATAIQSDNSLVDRFFVKASLFPEVTTAADVVAALTQNGDDVELSLNGGTFHCTFKNATLAMFAEANFAIT